MIRSSFAAGAIALAAGFASAQSATVVHQSAPHDHGAPDHWVEALDDGSVLATDDRGVYHFETWGEYAASDFFHVHGKHCGTTTAPFISEDVLVPYATGTAADCTSSFNDPGAIYEPQGNALYQIPVVVHVIQAPNGQGFIPDSMVESQIDVLNEDFRAIAGSLGAPGTDVRIEFYLATVDPSGNPTNGITRHTSKKWFQDQGNYGASIGWDTTRYLNIYTNSAAGNLGYAYVPNGGGIVGSSFDGVRILWSAFGRNAPIGYPYDLGRTTTHEVGHYLGLYHTFDGGCASAASCNVNGDLICDTNPESGPNSYPCSKSSCGSSDPTQNYMDYSYDLCMDNFTSEQARRMRCTLENWRVDLAGGPPVGNASPSVSIASPSNGATFNDGDTVTLSGSASDPEDGSLTGQIAWVSSIDGALGSGGSVNTTLSVGSHVITASVTDSGNASADDQISVTVQSIGGGGIALSTVGQKVKGRLEVTLTWSGASGGTVDVYRNGSFLTSVNNDGAYVDKTGFKGSGSVSYQVCDTGGCSNVSNVSY